MAAAAYRSGQELIDERTGEKKNYKKKRGVEFETILYPTGIKPLKREELWNMAERAEKRKDAVVGREYRLAFPCELNFDQRKKAALIFGKILNRKYAIAADISMHLPDKKGDQRNYHAHVLTTTRSIDNDGLKEKTRILDDKKQGKEEIKKLRHIWFAICNDSLEKAGYKDRLDPRSFHEQGLDILPTIHLGPAATNLERQGIKTDLGNYNRDITARNAAQAKNKSQLDTDSQTTLTEAERASQAAKWAKERLNVEYQTRLKEIEAEAAVIFSSQTKKPNQIHQGDYHAYTDIDC